MVLLLVIPMCVFPAQAATSAEVQRFLDIICPAASEKMATSGILASLTIAQAIHESAWGTSGLAVNYNNLFGMKAYKASWDGPVYCRGAKSKRVYSNFNEAISILGDTLYKEYYNDFFRVYDSWAESLAGYHSLLNNNARYANIRGLTDYELACRYIVEDGYCDDPSYTDKLLYYIRNYELYKYDTGYTGSNTVTAVVLNTKTLTLKPGEGFALSATVYPSTATEKTISYTTSDISVASVTTNGVIKAVSSGSAVITASASNGIKASVSVVVSPTGVVMYKGTVNKDVYCRAAASDSTTNSPGIFDRNTAVIIYGDPVNGFYNVSGSSRTGDSITGYIYVSCIDKGDIYTEEPSRTATYNGVIKKEVYVRAEKSDSKDNNSGIFAVDTKVIIYDELDEGFYFVSGTNKAGSLVSGYIYEECVTITGAYVPSEPDDGTDPDNPGNSDNIPDISFSGDLGTFYSFGITLAKLNCRKGPATSYGVIGSFAKDAVLIVCGAGYTGDGIDGVWYFVKGIDDGGNPISGYCGGDYIKLTGSVLDTTDTGFESSFDMTNGYVMLEAEKLNPSDFKRAYNKLTVKLAKKDGSTLNDSEYIGTGALLTVSYSGMELFTKSVIIKGDLDGDGKITSTDYIRVRMIILGTLTADEPTKAAADIDGNSSTNTTDYIKIRQHILGIASLFS